MWICLTDCFLSIVSKNCAKDELLVRARRKGDIEKVFPGAKVVRVEHADYLFRAVVERAHVVAVLMSKIAEIDYPNFKDAVGDDKLHNAYLRVWTAMAEIQPRRPGGFMHGLGHYDSASLYADDEPPVSAKKKRKGARRRRPQATFMDLG